MDDMLRRLGNVEASVSLIKAEVSGLTTGMAHVATKADIESLKTTISASESSILKYFIGTIIAILVAFLAVAKFYKG